MKFWWFQCHEWVEKCVFLQHVNHLLPKWQGLVSQIPFIFPRKLRHDTLWKRSLRVEALLQILQAKRFYSGMNIQMCFIKVHKVRMSYFFDWSGIWLNNFHFAICNIFMFELAGSRLEKYSGSKSGIEWVKNMKFHIFFEISQCLWFMRTYIV